MNVSIVKTGYIEATKSTHTFKLSATLFRGGSVIKSKHNSVKFTRETKKFSKFPTRHAEINVCLGMSDKELKGLSLLVIRVNRRGEITCASPCPCCLAYLEARGVRKIYYSDWDGKIRRKIW